MSAGNQSFPDERRQRIMRCPSQYDMSAGEAANRIVDPTQESDIAWTVRPPRSVTANYCEFDAGKFLHQYANLRRTVQIMMCIRHITQDLQCFALWKREYVTNRQFNRKQSLRTGVSVVPDFLR
jgi:hypothetical protein